MSIDSIRRKKAYTFYTLNFFRRVVSGVYVPVILLFFLNKGITLVDFGVLVMVGLVVSALAELPTGIVADRIGQQKAVQIGLVLFVFAILIIVYSKYLPAFILAEVISSIGFAFTSGADVAWFNKVLEEEFQVDKKFRSVFNGNHSLSGTLGSITGSALVAASYFLGFRNLSAYLVVTVVSTLLALITSSNKFIELPKEKSESTDHESLLVGFNHFKKTFTTRLSSVFLMIALTFAYLMSINDSFWQTMLFKDLLQGDVVLFSALAFIFLQIGILIGNRLFAKVESVLDGKVKGWFAIMIAPICLTFLTLPHIQNNFVQMGLYTVLYTVPLGFFFPFLRTYTGKYLASRGEKNQATYMSGITFGMSLIGFVAIAVVTIQLRSDIPINLIWFWAGAVGIVMFWLILFMPLINERENLDEVAVN